MKEILEYIARNLVEDPDAVDVRQVESESDKTVVLELRVAPDDMGKVIGKRGRIARAIRSVMRAAGIREGLTTVIEIVD
ncbi:MAG: KH domain-containing protein [Actinomycetota bacterium]